MDETVLKLRKEAQLLLNQLDDKHIAVQKGKIWNPEENEWFHLGILVSNFTVIGPPELFKIDFYTPHTVSHVDEGDLHKIINALENAKIKFLK